MKRRAQRKSLFSVGYGKEGEEMMTHDDPE